MDRAEQTFKKRTVEVLKPFVLDRLIIMDRKIEGKVQPYIVQTTGKLQPGYLHLAAALAGQEAQQRLEKFQLHFQKGGNKHVEWACIETDHRQLHFLRPVYLDRALNQGQKDLLVGCEVRIIEN